ncbi:hypothetical protein ABBQ38_004346 [Trebouxia sp. C0009 RCD-2024]
MGRRKQQHPRALLGPQRDLERLDPTDSVDLVRASAGSASAVDRADVFSKPESVVISVEKDDPDAIPLRLLGIECKELSSVTRAQLSLSFAHEGSVTISWEVKGPNPDSSVICSVRAIVHASLHISLSSWN